MKNSKIEWCDHTFNPWSGCTKVSPGCLHCYAEALDRRWQHGIHWGKGAPRKRTSATYWDGPIHWHATAIEDAKARSEAGIQGHRPRVFCASLADWLDEEVPAQWLSDLLEVISDCTELDFLLLTKRPEKWRDRMEAVAELPTAGSIIAFGWTQGDIPANVWVGTSVEDQTRADLRIPQLLRIPAKVRFLSCEPLLGPVDLMYPTSIWPDGPKHCCNGQDCGCQGLPVDPPLMYGIDWVIVGGESGPECRPMAVEWAEQIALQVNGSRTKFFMKQLGGRTDKRHQLTDFPASLRIREFPS